MNAQAQIHASALVIGEKGVLIRGASGAGKSALALAMIEAARGGASLFARLIGDDRVLLSRAGPHVVARPHPAIAGLIEKRGQGLASVKHEPGALLSCVIDLIAQGAHGADVPPRMPAAQDLIAIIESVELPRLMLPAGLASVDAARRALAFIAQLAR
jgi:serine kinase of HPr protein (carbohydrate metabolism regulator)